MLLVALMAALHTASAADVQTYSVSFNVPTAEKTNVVTIQGLGSWPDIIAPLVECRTDRDIGAHLRLITFKKRVRHFVAKGEFLGVLSFAAGFSGTVTGDCTFDDAEGAALQVDFQLTADPSVKDVFDFNQQAQLVTAE